MKTVTIRDLRQRWPETEKALQVEHEIIITRDSKPVAKLVRIPETRKERARWDPEEHARWQKKVSRGKIYPSIDEALARQRADRWEQNQP
ncbi:MAG: type II toxin-antitoxin system Phd/YefM family antitoxin [Limisphaerales bacterium]